MTQWTAKIAQIFEESKSEFSGAFLLADGNDELFSAASGLANRDFDVPNTVDTRFDTASVTKTFTAVATLQLVDRGLLRLSDRITDIIDLHGTQIPEDVTIKHLLTHTSGIADDADEEAGEDYAALFVDKPNYSIRNCADFLPQFAYKEPNFKAGAAVRYNNCAFNLLGLAIEKLTGQTYRDYVTEHIFRPIGLENTCFQAKDTVCKNTAEGYFAVEDANGQFVRWAKNIYSFPPVGTADSGAYTTVRDLNLFLRSLKASKLLSPELSAEMLKPQVPFTQSKGNAILRFGYVFEFLDSDDGFLCIYKDGLNNGVGAMLSYYPQLDISLMLLSNQDGPLYRINRAMRGVLHEAYSEKNVR